MGEVNQMLGVSDEDIKSYNQISAKICNKLLTGNGYGKAEAIKEIAALDLSVERKILMAMGVQFAVDGIHHMMEDGIEKLKALHSSAFKEE